MSNDFSSLTVTNCILWEDSGVEIYNYESTPTVTYCDVQGGYTGTGNINADPLFVDPSSGDYHLQPGSPCIDAGDPNSPKDPDGTRADMGAFYFDQSAPFPGDVSGNGSVTAYDASLVLQYVVGLRELSDEDIDIADVTGDGHVTALDAALILQYTVGLITQFPSESKTVAPTLEAVSEEVALSKTIAQLEATTLNEEQRQVLEQLKRLVSQKLIPSRTALFQNYPNPFNPDTWLPYQLATAAPVTIRIYNTKGQLIRIINLGLKKAGIYITKNGAAYWDGKNATGETVSSGVYFYQLQAGGFFATRKMVIVK
ncbi:T9SS type A sorting domain-containing protein [Candidatus Poribacteria bacterium]|nr:T9SS type A sorting domain-containing protein [Candidatus Poribacteria bacterium]